MYDNNAVKMDALKTASIVLKQSFLFSFTEAY